VCTPEFCFTCECLGHSKGKLGHSILYLNPPPSSLPIEELGNPEAQEGFIFVLFGVGRGLKGVCSWRLNPKGYF